MWTFEGEVWVLNHQKEKFFQQQSSLTQQGLNHVESPNEIWNQLPTEADCRPWGERVQGWTLGLNVPSRDFVGLRKAPPWFSRFLVKQHTRHDSLTWATQKCWSKDIEGSLEVKLPTNWTDEKAEVGRVREEKRREEKRREKQSREKQSRAEQSRGEERRGEEE